MIPNLRIRRRGGRGTVPSEARGGLSPLGSLIHDPRSKIHGEQGFTLLELLLVIAITAILAIMGAQSLNLGRSTRARELNGVKTRAVAEIGLARTRAVQGEAERKWGVHFVNGTDDYYEIFSTPTTYSDMNVDIREVTYLPAGVTFSNPAESATLDVIFSRISGTRTTMADTITLQSTGQTVTIEISAQGLIE